MLNAIKDRYYTLRFALFRKYPVLNRYRYQINGVITDIKYFFLHRLHPKHKYHILKLHKPGYHDPRSQMINAVMLILLRYVDEVISMNKDHYEDGIRLGKIDKNKPHTFFEYYITTIRTKLLTKESAAYDKAYYTSAVVEYEKMSAVLSWWDRMKESTWLDSESAEQYVGEILNSKVLAKGRISFAEFEEINIGTIETVNVMLKTVIDMRSRLWT